MPYDITERIIENGPLPGSNHNPEVGRLKAIIQEREERIKDLENMLREEREETKLWVRRAKEHRTAAEAGEDIIKELRTRIEALEKDPVVATQNSRATEGKQVPASGDGNRRSLGIRKEPTIDSYYSNPFSSHKQRTPSQGIEVEDRRHPEPSRASTSRTEVAAPLPSAAMEHELDGLLGQLSWETFELIADHIIKWANNPERGDDGRTLKFLVRLIFERAADDAAQANLFANLCQTILHRISPRFQESFPQTYERGPVFGGALFRVYLNSLCVEELDRSWWTVQLPRRASRESSASAPIQNVRRRGLHLIALFGELYMLKILDEHLMHECIKKLIAIIESNSDSGDAVQALHTLLSTIGTKLDTPQSRTELDIQFRRMKSISKGTQYSAHNRSLLQDLLDLRKRKWVSLTEARVQSYKQLGFPSGSRTGSRLG